jgi:hypothetical protein
MNNQTQAILTQRIATIGMEIHREIQSFNKGSKKKI